MQPTAQNYQEKHIGLHLTDCHKLRQLLTAAVPKAGRARAGGQFFSEQTFVVGC